MRKIMALVLCLLLCTSLVLTGCIEDQSAGTKYDSYEDAMAAGDHGAAYSLLLGDENADPNELNKYLVVPVLVEGTESANGNTGNVKAEMVYDDNGLLLSHTVTDMNGSTTTYTYAYDDNSNLLTKSELGSAGDAVATWSYTYDGNGNMLSEVADHGHIKYTTVFTYNDKNQAVTEYYKEESAVDAYEYTWTMTYDEAGNMLTHLTAEGSGQVYTYDANGNITMEKEINASFDSYNAYLYTYDSEGRLISRVYEDGDGYESIYTYAYDSAGTRYTVEYQDGTEYSAVYAQKFDSEGRITENSYTNAAGVTRTQTYDQWGNVASLYWKNAEGWEQNYTFSHNEYGYRTGDTYSDNKNQSYEYTVTYKVYYYPEGAPDIFLFLEKLDDNDTIRLFI